MNFLNFRRILSNCGIEAEYRQYYFKSDAEQVFSGLGIWVLSFLLFSVSDFLSFSLSQTFFLLLTLRVAHSVFTGFLMYLLRRRIDHYHQLDGLILIWGFITVLVLIGIEVKHPATFFPGVSISLVIVAAFYMLLPTCTLFRVAPPLLFSAFLIVRGLTSAAAGNLLDLGTLCLSLITVNAMGIFFSARLHISRLNIFISHRMEVNARVELERQASTDPLTGVMNRRRILERLEEGFYHYRRYQRPFSILLMDLDGFKNVNDTFGHQVGDQVLIKFTELICTMKRESDVMGRLGGDEFCLFLPETQAGEAATVADRILALFQKKITSNDPEETIVTTSIGVSQVLPGDHSIDDLYARADLALYQAKKNGRNGWACVLEETTKLSELVPLPDKKLS